MSIYGFAFAKKFQILDFEDVIFVVGASPCLAYFQNKFLLKLASEVNKVLNI